jgi:FtsP/CotA-like multicopper oxidase with cupredoxin domain
MPRNISATSDALALRSATLPRSTIPTIAIMAVAVLPSLGMTGEPLNVLPLPLSLRAKDHTLSLTLHAAIAANGKNSFYFNGQPNAPTLRLSPGDQLMITYINGLPANPRESCAITPCMDMTNLKTTSLLSTRYGWTPVNVPYGGSVDVIMDFTNPVIRGMSVFHCHLLNHEDKGMMAKILFE